MDLSELLERADGYKARLAAARSEIGEGIVWYRYDILANLGALDTLLHGENRDLGRLAAGLPVADIGGADGDLAFMLEQIVGVGGRFDRPWTHQPKRPARGSCVA